MTCKMHVCDYRPSLYFGIFLGEKNVGLYSEQYGIQIYSNIIMNKLMKFEFEFWAQVPALLFLREITVPAEGTMRCLKMHSCTGLEWQD